MCNLAIAAGQGSYNERGRRLRVGRHDRATSSRKHPDGPATCKYTDSPQPGQITGAENGSSRKLIGVVRYLHCRIWSIPGGTAHRAGIPRLGPRGVAHGTECTSRPLASGLQRSLATFADARSIARAVRGASGMVRPCRHKGDHQGPAPMLDAKRRNVGAVASETRSPLRASAEISVGARTALLPTAGYCRSCQRALGFRSASDTTRHSTDAVAPRAGRGWRCQHFAGHDGGFSTRGAIDGGQAQKDPFGHHY